MFWRSIINQTVVLVLAANCFSVLTLGQDTTLTYQGELKENGSPASGVFNMDFSLWDASVGGNQVDITNSQNGVQVVNGRFTVDLDFGAEAFDNSPRWLEIAVEGITLSPRNPVSRTPYSIQTRGIFVDEDERVGIGRINPGAQLDVFSESENSGNNTARFYSPILGPNASHIHYGLAGDWYIRSADDTGRVVIQDTGGIVGIGGTPGDTAQLTVTSTSEEHAMLAFSLDDVQPTINAINIGSGAVIWASGNSDTSLGGGGLIVAGNAEALNVSIDANEIMARDNGAAAGLLINREGGDVIVGSASGGTSKLITPVLQITGGADFSEMFDVGGDVEAQPGMVVVIDPNKPGRLVLSTMEYDRKVAGIISGAGGVATGMTMGHDGTIADGKHPVALTGRVYCLVDASSGAIEPGDMLTTSATPGHAMKAIDISTAGGAIIGKAMTSLAQGEIGLVLVLVNLQ